MSEYEIPPYQIDPAALPPPLLTSEPGSFARRTFEERIPHIISETIAHNDFPPAIRAALADLRGEISGGRIRGLNEATPDAAFWNAVSQPYMGRTWLDVPWYWAESYFYRRVLEATGYFRHAPWQGFDPFGAIKNEEWQPDAAPRAVNDLLAGLPPDPAARFGALLRASLWGNRIDLSYRAAAQLGMAGHAQDDNLLADDGGQAWQRLGRTPGARVVLIADNAGTEQAMDLALIDFLLSTGAARQIALHLKPHPFFVSDAMPSDLRAGLSALALGGSHAAELANHIRLFLADGRLQVHTHWFYTTSLFYFQLPDDLRTELAGAALVILKGDANYRRLFGDAHWPPSTPFAAAASYFPAPLLALRTLKSEIVLGLQPGAAGRLAAADPDWLVNGRRGVIQGRLEGG